MYQNSIADAGDACIKFGLPLTYYYALDPDLFQELEDITQIRSKLTNDGWDFVDQQYGFEYSPMDKEWLESKQDHQMFPAQVPKPRPISHIVKRIQTP